MNNGMFIPNIPIGYGMPTFTGINPNLASGLGVARNLGLSRGLGGLSGKAGLFRSVNWGGLLNNASKALGVVNQAVPLVKQAGPMVNNMKSMLKLASMFKDETDGQIKTTSNNTTSSPSTSQYQSNRPQTNTSSLNESSQNITYSNSPNFFL